MVFIEPPNDFDLSRPIVSCHIEHDGKLLLLKRNPNKPQGGTWGAPAGKVDGGEDNLAALEREVLEETGIDLKKQKVDYIATRYVRYPEYDFTYLIYRTVLPKKPEIKLREKEHTDHCWVAPVESLSLDLIQDEDHCIKLIYGL